MSTLYSIALSNFESWNDHIQETLLKEYNWKDEKGAIEIFVKPFFVEQFPEYLYKSSFLILYAVSESAINRYINLISKIIGEETETKNYKPIWSRLKAILETSNSLGLKALSSKINWNILNAYRLIRNSIAHSNNIDTKNKTIADYVSLNKDKFIIEDDMFLQINSVFVETFMKDVFNIHELLLQFVEKE